MGAQGAVYGSVTDRFERFTIKAPGFAGGYLLEQAEEKLGPLNEGRKYHFVIPGLLGGEYGASNFQTVPLIEQIRFSGDLGRQIKELPDGAQVKLKVIE